MSRPPLPTQVSSLTVNVPSRVNSSSRPGSEQSVVGGHLKMSPSVLSEISHYGADGQRRKITRRTIVDTIPEEIFGQEYQINKTKKERVALKDWFLFKDSSDNDSKYAIFVQAFENLNKQVESGNISAKIELADILLHGDYGQGKNLDKAWELISEISEQQPIDNEVLLEIADHFLYGDETQKDVRKYRKILTLAKDQNNEEASEKLDIMARARLDLKITDCKKSNINEQNKTTGNTLLHLAVKYEDIGLIRECLKKGAKFGIKNKEGKEATEMTGDKTIIELVTNLSSANQKDKRTTLPEIEDSTHKKEAKPASSTNTRSSSSSSSSSTKNSHLPAFFPAIGNTKQ